MSEMDRLRDRMFNGVGQALGGYYVPLTARMRVATRLLEIVAEETMGHQPGMPCLCPFCAAFLNTPATEEEPK